MRNVIVLTMTLCACGCGRMTKPYTTTDKRIGSIRGEFAKWIKGHHPPRQLSPLSETKICRECRADLPRTNEFFFKHAGRHRDQLAGRCKKCMQANNRKWIEQHLDEFREYQRLYRLNNSQKVKAQIAAWLSAHPGYNATAAREWREENNEYYRQKLKTYRQNNQETCRSVTILYKHRKRAAYAERITAAQLLERYNEYAGNCGICDSPVTRQFVNWDHIEPISKGGKHVLMNLQPVHRNCNSLKGARDLNAARERVKILRSIGKWKEQ